MAEQSEYRVLISAENQALSSINGLTNGLRELLPYVKELVNKTKQVTKPIQDATRAVKAQTSAFTKLADSIKRIAFYRAIRTALKAVTQGVKEGINNLVLYSQALNNVDSAHATSTMSEFATTALYVKNSLGAALMPILQMLVPVVNAIADAFIWAANAVNQFFHAIKGESVFTKAKRYAVDYAAGLQKAGGAAKELKKQIFGFDELNIFNAPSAGGGGGGSPQLDPTKMFEESAISAAWGKIAELVKSHLREITLIVSAATLAIGAILALSGIKPTLGIALIAAGAIGLAAGASNWDIMDSNVKSAMTKIIATIGGFVLAVGAIVALSGANLPLGIGLVAAGATALGSAAALNWDFLGKTVDEKIAFITGIVSVALLFLGAVLALTGHLPIGLGLLVGGALGLAAGATMNDDLKNKLAKHIAEIEVIIGLAALFLGVVAAFTGHILVGCGLLVLGAAALGKGHAELKDDLKKKIGDKLTAIENIVKVATVALGGVLLFVNPALGLPLLITGLALVGKDIDWDALNKKIKEKWEAVKQTGRNIVADIKGFVNKIKNFFSNLINFNAQMTLTPSMQWEQNNPYNAGYYAEGGIPKQGSLFWAGESGAELIGQVGSRTTVTNQETFTAGMEGIMDNTNTVIMQVGQAVVQAILSQDMTPIVQISDRAIVNAYDRGKRLGGTGLVTGSGIV